MSEKARTIEQTEIVRLSVEDQQQIAEGILNPPEPAPALRKVFQQYRDLFGPIDLLPR